MMTETFPQQEYRATQENKSDIFSSDESETENQNFTQIPPELMSMIKKAHNGSQEEQITQIAQVANVIEEAKLQGFTESIKQIEHDIIQDPGPSHSLIDKLFDLISRLFSKLFRG